jgi:hypothetical protein
MFRWMVQTESSRLLVEAAVEQGLSMQLVVMRKSVGAMWFNHGRQHAAIARALPGMTHVGHWAKLAVHTEPRHYQWRCDRLSRPAQLHFQFVQARLVAWHAT